MPDSLAETLKGELDYNLPEISADTYKTRWTPSELLAADFPEPSWIVPGTIPSGLINWGGRPKMGKSYFWKQVSFAVGSGGKVFGLDVPRGKVLYLALEDSARRLQKNLREMRVTPDCDIQFALNWPPLQGKGTDQLAAAIETNNYSLVVVDTFARAIPGIDQNKAEVVGPIVGRLQGLAGLHNNCIVLIDHTRKPSGLAADPIDDIINSTAKTASTDAIFAMYREPGKPGVRLLGRGRDMDEVDIRMYWDRETFSWQSRGDSGELELTEHRQAILTVLEELGKSQASSIAKAVKQDLSNTSKRLNELVNAGFVFLEVVDGKKYYVKNT